MKNIHILSTDKPSRIAYYQESTSYNKPILQLVSHTSSDYKYQNIYITNEEEIKINDYITDGYSVWQWKDNSSLLGRKKVVLTTNQDLITCGVQSVDDEFLEWLIKNPTCERVDVESFCKNGDDCPSQGAYDKQHLCNLGYKIILPNLEIWKDIPEFEGYYQISNLGNVKSLSRTILGRGKHNALLKERLLKFSTSTNGYYQVILQKECFKKIYKVHSLVAICFLNHIPDGTHNVVIDHINEVKTDNRLENLRLISHRENVARSMKNNTSTYVGVSWSKNAKKWISQITIEGKTKYLGLFDNEEDANKKYLETLKDL